MFKTIEQQSEKIILSNTIVAIAKNNYSVSLEEIEKKEKLYKEIEQLQKNYTNNYPKLKGKEADDYQISYNYKLNKKIFELEELEYNILYKTNRYARLKTLKKMLALKNEGQEESWKLLISELISNLKKEIKTELPIEINKDRQAKILSNDCEKYLRTLIDASKIDKIEFETLEEIEKIEASFLSAKIKLNEVEQQSSNLPLNKFEKIEKLITEKRNNLEIDNQIKKNNLEISRLERIKKIEPTEEIKNADDRAKIVADLLAFYDKILLNKDKITNEELLNRINNNKDNILELNNYISLFSENKLNQYKDKLISSQYKLFIFENTIRDNQNYEGLNNLSIKDLLCEDSMLLMEKITSPEKEINHNKRASA
ncbi:MAG: hypothetical protein PHN42_02700 [Bacilli bacterium]|nr:hypothetical protein [Bacilli bacterium]